jgi:hypothetical protein
MQVAHYPLSTLDSHHRAILDHKSRAHAQEASNSLAPEKSVAGSRLVCLDHIEIFLGVDDRTCAAKCS